MADGGSPGREIVAKMVAKEPTTTSPPVRCACVRCDCLVLGRPHTAHIGHPSSHPVTLRMDGEMGDYSPRIGDGPGEVPPHPFEEIGDTGACRACEEHGRLAKAVAEIEALAEHDRRGKAALEERQRRQERSRLDLTDAVWAAIKAHRCYSEGNVTLDADVFDDLLDAALATTRKGG